MDTNKPVWPKTYIPSPVIPVWFSRGLELMGGINPFGNPNYRVVWGMDERGFMNDNPRAIKYANPNDPELGWACFLLERYATPAFFNKPAWKEQRYGLDGAGSGKMIDFLGPFPSRGDYIMCAQLMTDDFAPLDLSMQLLEELQNRSDVTPGSQNLSGLGAHEIKRRLRAAKNTAIVDAQLEERFEYYRVRADEINAKHSRKFVGLLNDLPASPRIYRDDTGAKHTLWQDKEGNGNARIDFTMPA